MLEQNEKEKWRELATKQLKGTPPESLNWLSPEGITVKPLYTAEDLTGFGHLNTLPGFPPYVRGPMATMYAGRPWTIRHPSGIRLRLVIRVRALEQPVPMFFEIRKTS